MLIKSDIYLPIVDGTKVFIYNLIDPLTQEICYIGRTTDPLKRYATYRGKSVRSSVNGNTWFDYWVDSLTILGYDPDMHIIHVASDKEEGKKAEAFYINQYWHNGFAILNRSNHFNRQVQLARMAQSSWFIQRHTPEMGKKLQEYYR